MLVYFAVFLISFMFAYLAEKSEKLGYRKNFIFFSILAILIPSIFAGLRASGVGTDTKVYIDGIFNRTCLINTFSDLWKYMFKNGEFLYVLLNFVVSRFSSSVNMIYFFIQLIIMSFTYLSCYYMMNKKNYSISYLIYMLLFFNVSLNMARQSIAISIILFSLKFVFNRKFWKFLFCVFIAFAFHNTAIIALLFYPLFKLLDGKNKFILKIFILLLSLCTIFFFATLMEYLVKIFPLFSKYVGYVSYGQNNIPFISKAYKFLCLALILISSKNMKNYSETGSKLSFVYIIGVIMYFVGLYGRNMQRISLYFTYIVIFVLPYIFFSFKRRKDKTMINIISLCLILIYSYVCYGIFNWNQTVPYISILGK